WWPLKKVGFNNPLEIKLTKGYQQLLDYWHGKGPAPAADIVYQTLMELADNVKLENCIYHRDVTDAMFRQVNSDTTIPFKTHALAKKTYIQAVDYDLGRNNFAYFDNDTASYQFVSPPVKTTGNHGRVYRNDGVDIEKYQDNNGSTAYYIDKIEDGEWLQYTIKAAQKGVYTLMLHTLAKQPGEISISLNGNQLAETIIPPGGNFQNWQQVEVRSGIHLLEGMNVLRFKAKKGGFDFKGFELLKVK